MAHKRGNDKAQSLYGTGTADLLEAFGGNDRLFGRNGDDDLWAGFGDDALFGDAGNDWLMGEGGNDRMWGGVGNDALNGGDGSDLMRGEAGHDWHFGAAGDDTMIETLRDDENCFTDLMEGGEGFDIAQLHAKGPGAITLWNEGDYVRVVIGSEPGYGDTTVKVFDDVELIDLHTETGAQVFLAGAWGDPASAEPQLLVNGVAEPPAYLPSEWFLA